MRYVLTPEQGRACVNCPWRDRRQDDIIVCPRAYACENVKRVLRKPEMTFKTPARKKDNEHL